MLDKKPDMSPLVLASSSQTRATVLSNAGLGDVAIDPPHVDEDSVKEALRAEGADAAQVADALAELKALAVSRRHPGAFVIGGDQTLDCRGVWFDKPSNIDVARDNLRKLRGQRHTLFAGICVVKDGQRLWHTVEPAYLTMRNFDDGFLDWYLDEVGDDVTGSVGCYRLEGVGAQLFDRIDGDFFTILGLPLLPLLAFLRQHGLVPA